jgi:hypothetical protein
MEVVAHARVPDTSSETNDTKNKQGEDKVLEPSEKPLLLDRRRRRRRGRGCQRDVCDSGLGLANIVKGGLMDSLGRNGLGSWQNRLLSRIELGLLLDGVETLESSSRLVYFWLKQLIRAVTL